MRDHDRLDRQRAAIVFLSGNQRSGKTLVQLLLSSHPEVSISPGSNTIQQLFYELPRHRLLLPPELRRVRELLAADRKLRAWRIDGDELERRVRDLPAEVTVRDVAGELMRCFRDQTKPAATVIGNKKGFYCKAADLVREVFPEARFVFLMRDGRGAVASMLDNQPEHDVVSASLMWRLKAYRIRILADLYPRQCFVVRYERLVAEPEETCRDLCRFLGLAFSERMLADYRTNDAVRHLTDESHAATYQEITTDFVHRWKKRLSLDELEVVESIAGAELVAHGYRLETRGFIPWDRRLHGAALAARDHLDWLGTHLKRKYLVF